MTWSLQDYDFELDDALIARFPPPHREDARLLVVTRSTSSLHSEPNFPCLLSYITSEYKHDKQKREKALGMAR